MAHHWPRSAQHRYQYRIADDKRPSLGDVPHGRRMMAGDHRWHVGKGPAGGGQVQRDPLFLSGEEHHVVEAAAGQERFPADHRPARYESQDGRPRSSGGDAERSGRHLGARWVETLERSHEYPGGQQGEPGVGVQHISSQSKCPGRPPRIVVGEGDVGCVGPGHAHVTGLCPPVGSQFHDLHPWMAFPDCSRGAVHRAVVDHDHIRLVARQRTLQVVAPVPGSDDDRDPVLPHNGPCTHWLTTRIRAHWGATGSGRPSLPDQVWVRRRCDG